MPSKKKQAQEKSVESFEAALQELDQLTERLAHEPDSLNNLITDYERGQKLIRFCHQELATARERIELIHAKNQVQPEVKEASEPNESCDNNDDVRLF
ncbi:MAG: exodeoxyribonuclease VII small subunit [Akkermansiaceae bacterium]